jgi:LDH2 family malate/lactate/ureidoglycolate dehydrogenase
MYVEEIREGAVDPNAEPSVLKESVSTAYLSGNNGLGPVVGNLSMNLAISKAKSMGVSLVVAKGTYAACCIPRCVSRVKCFLCFCNKHAGNRKNDIHKHEDN